MIKKLSRLFDLVKVFEEEKYFFLQSSRTTKKEKLFLKLEKNVTTKLEWGGG